MMYDGTEYQATWSQKGINSSAEAKKHHYLRTVFWSNPLNHFWENDNYTEAGKEHCRAFVKSLRPTFEHKEKNLR